MPLPALVIAPVAAAAPWILRKFVQYAWGPMLVGLGHLFKTRLGLFIATAMVWMGINFTTINLLIDPAIELLRGATQSAGSGGTGQFAAAASGYLGILQFDRAITMLISAVATKHLLLKGRLFLFRRATP